MVKNIWASNIPFGPVTPIFKALLTAWVVDWTVFDRSQEVQTKGIKMCY